MSDVEFKIIKKGGLSIISASFWALSLILFANLNGVSYMILGVQQIFSPIILVFSILGIVYAKPKRSDFSGPFIWLILTLITSFLISLLSGLYFMPYTNFELFFLKRGFIDSLTSTIIILVFYLMFKKLSSENQLKSLKIIFYFFLFATSIGTFEPFLGIRDLYSYARVGTRSLGIFGNPNTTGAQACFTLSIGLGLYIINKIRFLVIVPAVLISVAGAVLSFSKSSIINATLVLIFFVVSTFLFSFKRTNWNALRRRFILIATFVVLFFVFILPTAQKMYENFSSGQIKRIDNLKALVLKGEFNTQTTSERSEILPEVLIYLKSNPFFGYGTHTFTYGGNFSTNRQIGVHNLYMKIFLEGGLIPFVLFMFFLLYFMINAFRIRQKNGVFFLLVTPILVFSFASLTGHSSLYNKAYVALLGVLLALNYKLNLEQQKLNKKN